MHLLFATSIVPDGALASGYEIANAAIIDALAARRRARHGARLHLAGKASQPIPKTPWCWARSTCAPTMPLRGKSSPGSARRCSSGLTFASVKLRAVSDERCPRRDRARRAVRRLCAEFRAVRRRLRRAVRRPALDLRRPQCRASFGRENAAAAGSLFQRLLFRREARLLKVMEERLCRQRALRLHAGRGRPRRARRRLRRPLGGAAAGDRRPARRRRTGRAASTATPR